MYCIRKTSVAILIFLRSDIGRVGYWPCRFFPYIAPIKAMSIITIPATAADHAVDRKPNTPNM